MKRVNLIICLALVLVISLFMFFNEQSNNILAVVVPHHNYVKKERLEFWNDVIKESKIKKDKIEKVIIVGPDHFGTIKTNISYDNTSWSTYNSKLDNFFERPDYFPGNYVLNTDLLKWDHAIANLIGEVHDNFPNAQFVPFIIGEKTSFKDLEVLIKYINETCTKNCILVTSVDFSHYVTLDISLEQDERTINILSKKLVKENTFNQNDTIEADSPASLYVMQEFAISKNLNWLLFNQTNSAKGNTETTDTTSHIFGAYIGK